MEIKKHMGRKYVAEDVQLARLILKGYVLEKTVRKFSTTSGVIFVPKRWIGRKFKVIMIPIEEIDEVMI